MKRPVFKKTPLDSSDSSEAGNGTDPGSEEPIGEIQETAMTEQESEIVDESGEIPPTEAAIDHEYVQRLENEVKENYDKYLRAMAELENVKKRAVRERSDLLKYASENLGRDLLEIADNFQLAFSQNMPEGNEEFLKGFRLIYDRLMAIMEQHQIKGESAQGSTFDPNKHQALASVPTADHPPGTVIEEFKRAYFIKDKLLRPAQVVVSIAEEGAAEGQEKTE